MIGMFVRDIKAKLEKSPKGFLMLDEQFESRSRKFTYIDSKGAHYFDKTDDSEHNQDIQYISWEMMEQQHVLFMKIYHYVMEIK
jgi:hypothetical protein